LKVLRDLRCYHVRRLQVLGPFEALVPQPEDIEVCLVAADQLLIAEGPETLRFLSLMLVVGVVAGYEFLESLRLF